MDELVIGVTFETADLLENELIIYLHLSYLLTISLCSFLVIIQSSWLCYVVLFLTLRIMALMILFQNWTLHYFEAAEFIEQMTRRFSC